MPTKPGKPNLESTADSGLGDYDQEKAAADAAAYTASRLGTVTQTALFTDTDYHDVKSFADAMLLLANAGVAAESVDDYGSGLRPLEDADALIGVPFVAIEWIVRDGEYGEYVSITYMTDRNEKGILNGGVSLVDDFESIAKQREDVGNPEPRKGLLCPRGLRKSTYFFDESTGKALPKGESIQADGKKAKPGHSYYIV